MFLQVWWGIFSLLLMLEHSLSTAFNIWTVSSFERCLLFLTLYSGLHSVLLSLFRLVQYYEYGYTACIKPSAVLPLRHILTIFLTSTQCIFFTVMLLQWDFKFFALCFFSNVFIKYIYIYMCNKFQVWVVDQEACQRLDPNSKANILLAC